MSRRDRSGSADGERRVAAAERSPARRGLGVLLMALGLLLGAWIVDPALSAAQGAAGQAGPLARQSLRPYGHVFVAYALAWALVLGWVVSLGRRWSRVEDELGKDADDG